MGQSGDAMMTAAWRAALGLFVRAALALAPARAQPTHIAPKLVAESPAPAPGGVTAIALAMTPEKVWHGYWTNGGDAGFGLRVKWIALEGVTISHLRYPVPEPLIQIGSSSCRERGCRYV